MKQISKVFAIAMIAGMSYRNEMTEGQTGDSAGPTINTDVENLVQPEVPVTQSAEVAAGLVGADAEVPTAQAAPDVPATAKPLTPAQQKKADEKAAKEKAKADKAAEKAKAAADKTQNDEVAAAGKTQNGVTRPGSGLTKRVWDAADAMSAAAKQPIDRKSLTDALLAEGLVVGTIHTQYGKWRKYHGLVTVKEPKVEVPAAPTAPAVPVPPAPAAA